MALKKNWGYQAKRSNPIEFPSQFPKKSERKVGNINEVIEISVKVITEIFAF